MDEARLREILREELKEEEERKRMEEWRKRAEEEDFPFILKMVILLMAIGAPIIWINKLFSGEIFEEIAFTIKTKGFVAGIMEFLGVVVIPIFIIIYLLGELIGEKEKPEDKQKTDEDEVDPVKNPFKWGMLQVRKELEKKSTKN
jgi:hypothetical protein